MEPEAYRLRPLEDNDVPALARIFTEQLPEQSMTAEEYRYILTSLRAPPQITYEVVAEAPETREVVAVAELRTRSSAFDPRRFWAGILVDPAHEGRGLGRRLAEHLIAEARARDAWCLVTDVRADRPRHLRFFERSGFVERRRTWQSRLDVSRPTPGAVSDRTEALRSEGIECTTLAELGSDRPEVRERLYQLHAAASADVPRMGTYTPEAREDFFQWTFASPGFLPEAYFLAVRDDTYVGLSNLESTRGEPGVLMQVFTGTRPEWRGRGIATELKRRGIEYARTHGYREIRTHNDTTNAPIWAINRHLGFAKHLEFVVGDLSLGPRPPGT